MRQVNTAVISHAKEHDASFTAQHRRLHAGLSIRRKITLQLCTSQLGHPKTLTSVLSAGYGQLVSLILHHSTSETGVQAEDTVVPYVYD